MLLCHDGMFVFCRKISKEEFTGEKPKAKDMDPESKAELAFNVFDKNHDGYVTKSEMLKVSKNLTKEQVCVWLKNVNLELHVEHRLMQFFNEMITTMMVNWPLKSSRNSCNIIRTRRKATILNVNDNTAAIDAKKTHLFSKQSFDFWNWHKINLTNSALPTYF